jgi:hypothetical protein
VTSEASAINGVLHGADAVRDVISYVKTLYKYQEFNVVGDYGDHNFLEDYVARVQGEPIGAVVVVRRNEAGQTKEIVVSYRPLNAVLLLTRRLAQHFPGTEYTKYFGVPAGAAACVSIQWRAVRTGNVEVLSWPVARLPASTQKLGQQGSNCQLDHSKGLGGIGGLRPWLGSRPARMEPALTAEP